MSEAPKRIVLAYSGGLDTSVILTWLKETYGAEVVAYAADLGQGDDLDEVRQKALDTGAVEAIVEDLRTPFVRDYVWPMLRTGAIYEDGYLLGTSIARPLIAKGQVEAARRTNADAVSHGATGKGNDQVRFELGFAALGPDLQVIAPWREWDLNSRTVLLEYAERHGIPVGVTQEKPYSIDQNLLHTSYEGGILEDPWASPPKDMFQTTVDPVDAPDTPEAIELDFEQGDLVAIDGTGAEPHLLLARLNELAGRHGVGRIDIVENRFVGIKSRGVYETPGGTVIYRARQALETITMDREVLHLRNRMIPAYAEMVYNGFWFAPERITLQAMMDEAAKTVTGTVRLQLYKGGITTLGRKAPQSLYRADLSTFEADEVYDQQDAEGFIRLNGLRLRVGAHVYGLDRDGA